MNTEQSGCEFAKDSSQQFQYGVTDQTGFSEIIPLRMLHSK
jgi:hypothetical protein